MARTKSEDFGKYGPTKPYSLRYMPDSFKDRLRELAAYETTCNRQSGGGIKTMEGLALDLIAEGLDRREAERKAKAGRKKK